MFIEDVLSGNGTSVQIEATSTDPNSTVVFTLVNGQGAHVTLNSSGYLTIGPDVDTSFYFDVSSIYHFRKLIAKTRVRIFFCFRYTSRIAKRGLR